MKTSIACPKCKQQYEVDDSQLKETFECGVCGQSFIGHEGATPPVLVPQKKQEKGGSPILGCGGIFFLSIILFFIFYPSKKDTPSQPPPAQNWKYGVSESYLKGQAYLKTIELVKKRITNPGEASFGWGPDSCYEFDYLGKYGVNLTGTVKIKTAFGGTNKTTFSSTWHYDPQTKTWESKAISVNY